MQGTGYRVQGTEYRLLVQGWFIDGTHLTLPSKWFQRRNKPCRFTSEDISDGSVPVSLPACDK